MRYDLISLLKKMTTEDVVVLLNSLGISSDQIKRSGSSLIFPTICHNTNIDQASPKLYYYEDTKKFFCYTNCKSMSIIDLIVNIYKARGEELSFSDAMTILGELVTQKKEGFTIISLPKMSRPQEVAEGWESMFPDYNKTVLERFTQDPQYLELWTREGMDYNVLIDFGIRFDMTRNRMIIPILNHRGVLIGIKVRNFNQEDIDDHRKYMPLWYNKKTYTYPKLMVAYGLYENRKFLKKCKEAIVFEAEKSVLQFGSMFTQNKSIALGGSTFSVYHGHLLKELGVEKIVLGFDNDWHENGNKFYGLEKAIKEGEKIANMGFIVEIMYDYENNLLEDKESPVDKGRKTYSKIYRNRQSLQHLLKIEKGGYSYEI
jgi:hypothetical protein